MKLAAARPVVFWLFVRGDSHDSARPSLVGLPSIYAIHIAGLARVADEMTRASYLS